MLRQCKEIPLNQNINGWPLNGQVVSVRPALTGEIEADWIVIGSGFAGLAFAERLALLNPALRIILIDAASAVDSSSARNSGFMISLPHNIGSATAELKKAHDYRALLREGVRLLQEKTKNAGIDCDWENSGKYHCMVDPSGEKILEEYAASLKAIEEPFEELDSNALHEKLGTRFYRKGIYTPDCVLINPAKLVAGLAQNLPESVRVFDQTPALSITYGEMITVTTPMGSLKAPYLMLATNALSAGLYPSRTHQAAMATYASLTEPLTPEQRDRLPSSVTAWGLTPVNAIAGATLRYTSDHRFLIRQSVEAALNGQITPQQTQTVAKKHNAFFQKVFPQLHDVALSQTWSGTISVTRNGAPVWGALRPKVYSAGGCNGAGISKQTIAGYLLAEHVSGKDNPLIEIMRSLGQASTMPPQPLLSLAINAALWKERFMGRKEG